MKAVGELGWLELSVTMLIIFFGRTLIFAGGSSLWIALAAWPRKFFVDQQERRKIPLFREILWAAFILCFDAFWVTLAIIFGVLKLEFPGSPRLFFATFAAMFVWTEIYFYYSHRLIHHPKLFWIHRHHHANRPVSPWTSLAFSIPERLILLLGTVLIPGIVSQWLPISQEGFAFYFLVNYILNVYGHLNVEIVPYKWAKLAFGNVMNTTTYHSLHHMRYNGHYGLYTQFLDRWHKTRFADFWDFHKKING
jgi:sterol desaturase/sphingolipid hydroxylase (fatty acid hydroxylase superfamily)